MRPDRLLAHLLTSDPARPRVTYYDDTEGPTRGERVELSARVLANWVAKASSLLVEALKRFSRPLASTSPGSTWPRLWRSSRLGLHTEWRWRSR